VDLRDYVRLLRIRKALIITCILLGLAAAAGVTLLATPIYEARARLFVSTDDSSGVGAAYTGSLFTQQRVKSYTSIIDSPPVATAVIDELGLSLTPEELAAKVSASAPLDTVLLNVSVRDPAPVVAQRIANSVAENFIKVINQLERADTSGKSLVQVSVVNPAPLPGAPVSPRKQLNLALGLLVGLAVGVGSAVAKETLDQSVKGVEDMQDAFGLPTLAVIAHDPQAKNKPLISQLSSDSPRSESFRQLRTNLQFVNVDQRPRSIVITSAVPEEGKSTTACNLAISLARAGVPVILLEGDLRRPKVGDYLGLASGAGLTDVIIGRATIDDVLQPWGTDGQLFVMLSGPRPPNPSELLGSRHMSDLLAELERRALVIIDAPPLLPVTDAAILAAEASGALLVVAAKRTRRDQLRQALENLNSVGAHVFGGIFNMAPTRGPDSYRYGYGYGYGYTAVKSRGKVHTEELPQFEPSKGFDSYAGPREFRSPDQSKTAAMPAALPMVDPPQAAGLDTRDVSQYASAEAFRAALRRGPRIEEAADSAREHGGPGS
jgi:non-specific protein-tyrosine kinase